MTAAASLGKSDQLPMLSVRPGSTSGLDFRKGRTKGSKIKVWMTGKMTFMEMVKLEESKNRHNPRVVRIGIIQRVWFYMMT